MKEKIKHIIFTIFLLLPGLFFLVNGFQWLISPESAASAMMMPLLSGSALNSQVSDIGGMFLGLGLSVMGAVFLRKGEWLKPVSFILGCIGVYRILTFSLCEAALVPQMVLIEIVLSIWFFTASKKMSKVEKSREL